MMMIFVFVILFFGGGWQQTLAQNIELSGHKITLPEGNILGVAFHEQKDLFFVQQLVISTGEGGRTILSSRQISSWSFKNRSFRNSECWIRIHATWTSTRVDVSQYHRK